MHGTRIESLQYLGYCSNVITIINGGTTISNATIKLAHITPLIFPVIFLPFYSGGMTYVYLRQTTFHIFHRLSSLFVVALACSFSLALRRSARVIGRGPSICRPLSTNSRTYECEISKYLAAWAMLIKSMPNKRHLIPVFLKADLFYVAPQCFLFPLQLHRLRAFGGFYALTNPSTACQYSQPCLHE